MCTVHAVQVQVQVQVYPDSNPELFNLEIFASRKVKLAINSHKVIIYLCEDQILFTLHKG